jgi:putative ABC transport system substrate-binding protein
VPRIGFIAADPPDRQTGDPEVRALLAGLQDYGYVDGQNIQVEPRFPTAVRQNAKMINELLSLGVDVLLTEGTNTTQAAQFGTSTVPIVGIYTGDPLGTGLVQSLSRPGGNVTVISQDSPDVNGKRLELLHQIVPSAARIGLIYVTWNPPQITGLPQVIDAARQIGLEVVPSPVSSTDASDLSVLDQAIDAAMGDNAQAFYVWPPLGGRGGWSRIAARLKDFHLPSVGGNSEFSEVGGLSVYGANVAAINRRAGYFVDRILKGTSPADLPVEFPTVFDVAINRSTAAAIGFTIPPEVSLQVTEWVP